ncbi:MAG: hypothetical protein ACRBCJ_01680 [Hyphomicrobiaceae bacterium]
MKKANVLKWPINISHAQRDPPAVQVGFAGGQANAMRISGQIDQELRLVAVSAQVQA